MAKEQSEIPTLKELIDSDQRLRSLRTRNAQAVMASELYDIPIDIFIQRKECSKSGVWRAKRQTKLGYNYTFASTQVPSRTSGCWAGRWVERKKKVR